MNLTIKNLAKHRPEGEEGPEYEITFHLAKEAVVTIDILNDEKTHLYLNSHTDGYHWLHYWLAQEPHASILLDLKPAIEKERVRQLFAAYDIHYAPEDKGTCFLQLSKPLDRNTLKLIATIIYPRFALREKFIQD